jgi:hypothetical protein
MIELLLVENTLFALGNYCRSEALLISAFFSRSNSARKNATWEVLAYIIWPKNKKGKSKKVFVMGSF